MFEIWRKLVQNYYNRIDCCKQFGEFDLNEIVFCIESEGAGSNKSFIEVILLCVFYLTLLGYSVIIMIDFKIEIKWKTKFIFVQKPGFQLKKSCDLLFRFII